MVQKCHNMFPCVTNGYITSWRARHVAEHIVHWSRSETDLERLASVTKVLWIQSIIDHQKQKQSTAAGTTVLLHERRVALIKQSDKWRTRHTLSISNIDSNRKAHRSIRGTRATGYTLNSSGMSTECHQEALRARALSLQRGGPPPSGAGRSTLIRWPVVFAKHRWLHEGITEQGVECQRAVGQPVALVFCRSDGARWFRV